MRQHVRTDYGTSDYVLKDNGFCEHDMPRDEFLAACELPEDMHLEPNTGWIFMHGRDGCMIAQHYILDIFHIFA